MNFDRAFEILLKHEGGFSDHAADPGGKTRFGVTEAVAREVGYRGDMRDLPLDLAKRIYRERYWDAVKADELPASLRYVVFDAAVNSGPGQAIKWLQRSAGAVDDGVLGPKTMTAIQTLNADTLRQKILAQRLKLMTSLATWPAFGRGWARRIADLLEA